MELNRVDLTTANGGRADLLRKHLQELRRRVERDLRLKGIEMFIVETTEANGVLHMIWAWHGGREFIVDYHWLSGQWEKIHGAWAVWIRRMRLSKEDIRRVGRYFAVQCLSDQRGALKRISWSWRRSRFALGKTWSFMVKQFRLRSKESTWCVSILVWWMLLFRIYLSPGKSCLSMGGAFWVRHCSVSRVGRLKSCFEVEVR